MNHKCGNYVELFEEKIGITELKWGKNEINIYLVFALSENLSLLCQLQKPMPFWLPILRATYYWDNLGSIGQHFCS